MEETTPERYETIEEMEAEAHPGRTGEPHGDDSLIGRFDRWNLTRFSAMDAVKSVTLTTVLLLIFAGGSVREAADELDPGLGRDIVKAVGEPTGWVSDQLPLADTRHDLTSWLSPEEELGGGGFQAGGTNAPRAGALQNVSSSPSQLSSLLVTGDSLATPLDIEVAQQLADESSNVKVIRDPHLATGISNSALVDWGELSASQAQNDDPEAVVLFIGANEGYPLPGASGSINCCGPDWEAEYSSRVGQMTDNYLEGGVDRVYWLTIPTQRDPDRKQITDTVNRAINEAAAKRAEAVRVIDTVRIFTPGGVYRDSMVVDGKEQIVRESDGIHLNDVGSALAAQVVLEAVDADFAD